MWYTGRYAIALIYYYCKIQEGVFYDSVYDSMYFCSSGRDG